MALPIDIRRRLLLPAIAAPMFLVTGPDLVREACKAGVMGALPYHNARSIEEFEAWLATIHTALSEHEANGGGVAPLAVNITLLATDEATRFYAACQRAHVDTVISAFGDPTEHIKRVHDWGGKAFHDVTSVRFAEKAIRAGADGLIAIGAGGGGHSGTMSHLALIPRLRTLFDGVLVMAGAVSTGSTIRAAEILGADLAYLGTRFIASREAMASDIYKQFIVNGAAADLIYTDNITGVAANWLREALRHAGLNPDLLPPRTPQRGFSHLPAGVRPWRDIWSAGQGIELIDDVPTVRELVHRLIGEYRAACATPSFDECESLVERALDQPK